MAGPRVASSTTAMASVGWPSRPEAAAAASATRSVEGGGPRRQQLGRLLGVRNPARLGGLRCRGNGRRVERRIGAQDRGFQSDQIGAGVDPLLVGESAPKVAGGLQCVRLPAVAVQREHEAADKASPERVCRDLRHQGSDQFGVSSGGEFQIGQSLGGAESLFL